MARVHVAVGVVINSKGRVLISKRHTDSHQGGLWEFPGGKVEAGESVFAALQRELLEELDIHIDEARALLQIKHDYSDKHVLLDVWQVSAFTGVARGREGQPLRWVTLGELPRYRFPAANGPIVAAIMGGSDTGV
jgi:8-oxo-dGTP diphosphatase